MNPTILRNSCSFFIIILLNQFTYGQEKRLMGYDLNDGSLDSIFVAYDSTMTADFTNYNLGNYNSEIANLNENTPTEGTYPNSQFTLKRKAAEDFDITNYPIRTSLKLFYIENDSLKGVCSGSLVSETHVLTAAHCALDFETNNILFDSLVVCPIYNDGVVSNEFDCSPVEMIYYFDDWEAGEDIAMLKLADPIGEKTGWLGMGFNEDDDYYNESVHYKFSYPSVYIPLLDPNTYNGDTLFYYYGILDDIEPIYIGAQNVLGIPGESGSSIIRVEQDEVYRSYGVLSFGNDIHHIRIKDWMFYSFAEVLKDTEVNVEDIDDIEIQLYPNPTTGKVLIDGLQKPQIHSIQIFDHLGKKVQFDFSDYEIDLSNLENGIYHLAIHYDEKTFHRSLIKIN